jgi:hypothetical protein
MFFTSCQVDAANIATKRQTGTQNASNGNSMPDAVGARGHLRCSRGGSGQLASPALVMAEQR